MNLTFFSFLEWSICTCISWNLIHHVRISKHGLINETWLLRSCSSILIIYCRSPGLQSLSLCYAKKITGKGFSRAIRHWKALEDIRLGGLTTSNYDHIFKEIAINCKNLRTITLYDLEWPPLHIGIGVADNLKNIKEIRLDSFLMSRCFLHVMMSKCSNLIEVDISNCVVVNFEDGEISQVRDVINSCLIKRTGRRRTEWSVDALMSVAGEYTRVYAESSSIKGVIDKLICWAMKH